MLTIVFLLAFVFCAPANPKKKKNCPDHPCPNGISDIGHCPDEGCGPSDDPKHLVDQELNRRKNISSDNGPSEIRTIQSIKDLHHMGRGELTQCGSREKLKELGEGKKITVVAWAATVRAGGQESANCELPDAQDTDNHIVLFDSSITNPVLTKESEYDSVTAEFTPRVRADHHPNFTREMLGPLIDQNWKPPKKKDSKGKDPKGKLLVRVTGLLMFDSGHVFGYPLHRATNWEIHPIFKMEFCPEGQTCRADSDDHWVDLDKYHPNS